MKRIFSIAILILSLSAGSCKKENTQANLSLLQHKWSIVSLRGEALYYAGKPQDYFDFNTDSMVYYFVGGIYDTAVYSLSSNGQTLSLYAITNGIRTSSASNEEIDVLTNTQLVFHSSQVGFATLDSLKR
jgi:hypothetical protein